MERTANLVNLKDVEKSYGARTVLHGVTLGVAGGERIGIVGANGGGKSTLLRLIAGVEPPDAGAVTRGGRVGVALLSQSDALDPCASVRDALVGERAEQERAEHEWAGEAAARDVLDGLLEGASLSRLSAGFDTPVGELSGGERRRLALARLLLDPCELLLLDEPTNHLDVEAVDWLARHLAARRGALLVVTHDRWFLDAVCTSTWELADGRVHRYEGGYATYVLARAERDRQEQARESRRRQLARKELAWLLRGPKARTAKAKFRVRAAEALIAEQPPERDRVQLRRFATRRVGRKAIELEGVSLRLGERTLLNGLDWLLAGGDRVALVGVNGSGKTTLLRLLAGELEPSTGTVERGPTAQLGRLSQDAVELPEQLSVLGALEEVKLHATLADGGEIGAGMLCELFGFRGARSRTRVAELSGGERRRLALMRLLMSGPNVLLLDEPTNDLDVETLTGLEDLLDRWPGTLVVVSHDRWFVQRVCDDVYALDPAMAGLRHLPGGIEQYLDERRDSAEATPEMATPTAKPGAAAHAARKRAQRVDRETRRLELEIERLAEREAATQREMAANHNDYARLAELQVELERLTVARGELEDSWLAMAESLGA